MTEKFSKRIEELKQQVEQLSYDNHVLKTSFVMQQEEIAELKAHCKAVDEVNEKMKNCLNCKHDNELDAEYCQNCDRPYKSKPIKDEWELSE